MTTNVQTQLISDNSNTEKKTEPDATSSPTTKPVSVGEEIKNQLENMMADAVSVFSSAPRPSEIAAQKYYQSVKKARDRCPVNSKRYLHQVHYITNKKKEVEAFLGWSDDIPPVHVGHAVSRISGINVVSPSGVIEESERHDQDHGADNHSGVHDRINSTSVDEEAALIVESPHHQDSSTALSGEIHRSIAMETVPEEDEQNTELPKKKQDTLEHAKEILTYTNAFLQDKYGNQVFHNHEISEFVKTRRRSLRRVLFMDMKIKRVSDIDTTQEIFRVKFHFYLTWLATHDEVQEYLKWESQAEQRKKTTTRKLAPWSPQWEPQLEFTNAIDTHEFGRTSDYKLKRGDHKSFLMPESENGSRKYDEHYQGWGDYAWDIRREQLGFDPRQGYWIRAKYDGDITFAEELELESFPFDCQDLTIYVKVAEDSSSYCDLVPFPRSGEYLLLDPQFSVVSEWILEDVISEFSFTDPQRSKSLTTYAVVGVHIKASRIWRSHISTFIITFCFFTLGLCIFALDCQGELGERLAYSITLLLADVAALQLMFDRLPTIPYLTLLDIYMYLCFVYLFSAIMWTGLAGGSSYLAQHDWSMFWVFLCIYVLLQSAFLAGALISRQIERTKLSKTDAELHEVIRAKTFFGLCCVRQGQKSPISVLWNRVDLLEENNADSEKNLIGKGILLEQTISRLGFY